MKQIEIKYEQVNYKYEAVDGTIFCSKDECEKYEKSAMCAIKSRIKDMSIKCGDSCDLLILGCGDHTTYVVVPQCAEDIFRINQLAALIDNDNASPAKAEFIGKPLALVVGYDYEWFDVYDLEAHLSYMTDGKFTISKVKEKKEKQQ